MGSVKKAVESVVEAPIDAVKSVAKGDIKGLADAGLRLGTFGVAGVDKGFAVNASDLAGKTPKVNTGNAVTDLKQEADKTSKQRQALFMTQGDILGEEVDSVGRKKRGSILGN